MPINFPNSPTNGEVYTVGDKAWVWNSTNSTWDAYSNSNITVSGNLVVNGNTTLGNGDDELIYNSRQVNDYAQRYRSSITSGTSWTSPAGVTAATFVIVGGGGGGAGCFATSTNTKAAGGGGAAGKIAVYKDVPIDPSTSYTLSLGTAGTAGSASPTSGGNGGSTTITVDKIISASGTVSTITSFQANVTGLSSTNGLSPGMSVVATSGTGSITGTATVIEVTSSTAIKLNAAGFTNGTITNLRIRNVLTAAGGTGGTSATNSSGAGGAGGTMSVYDYFDFVDSFSITRTSGLAGYQVTGTLGAGASGNTSATSVVSPTNGYPAVYGTPLSTTNHHLSPVAGNGGYGPTSPSVVAGATVTSTLYGFGGNGGSIQSPGGAQGAAGSAGVAGAIYVYY
jgi:hypothetical protein